MSTFAVFGMTRTFALAEARKKVRTAKGEGRDRVDLTPEQWDQACQAYADKVMAGARVTKLTQPFDAPQFAAHYMNLLKKRGECRDLSIKANAAVKLPNGRESRNPKTGKIKMAWQYWDTSNDRMRIGG